MAEIIELEKRRQQQENNKADALRDEKIDVLRKVIQCARCHLKCSRCGAQVEASGQDKHSELPYPLCSGCREEYEVFVKLRQGELTDRHYWHNNEWMEVLQPSLPHLHPFIIGIIMNGWRCGKLG